MAPTTTATQINSGLASAMQLVGVPHITYHNEQGVHCFVATAKIQLFESLSRACRKNFSALLEQAILRK
jgi:hypothetical protein